MKATVAALAACLMLTGCGSQDSIVGRWGTTSPSEGVTTYKADGTFTLLDYRGETFGKWTHVGTTLRLSKRGWKDSEGKVGKIDNPEWETFIVVLSNEDTTMTVTLPSGLQRKLHRLPPERR